MSDPCPVCESAHTAMFLRRERVPVHQHVLFDSRRAAVRAPWRALSLTNCDECGFIFNADFDASALSYGASYDNSQTHSPIFAAYVDELAHELLGDGGLRNRRIVEVGCGDGAFLRRLVADASHGNTGHGFDPSYRGPRTDLDGRLEFTANLYAPDTVVPADVVIARHVIEHVHDPVALMRTMARTVQSSVRPQVLVETPCVDWILRQGAVWDFFYEHCSYFSARSLGRAATLADLNLKEIRHTFGSQYLWMEAGIHTEQPQPSEGAGNTPSLAQDFGRAHEVLVRRLDRELSIEAASGPVALWGAGAKGVTFANLLDPGGDRLACVVDLNPSKQGRYLPGTGHEIVAPAELPQRGVATALLMNPQYRAEVEQLIAQDHLALRLIDPIAELEPETHM